MIPDKVFNDLLKSKTLGHEAAASLKLSKKLSKVLKKNMKTFQDASPGNCERFTYDNEHKEQDNLPGKLILEENSPLSEDETVNEAHKHHGIVRRFFREALNRESYDGLGGDLHGTVHYGEGFDNAFFGNVSGKGYQMVYGDGLIFKPLTRALDVAAHEIGHGIVQTTAALEYWYQAGALNESFADVFGICCKHWFNKTPILDANWLIGDEIVTEQFPGKALRSFKDEKAYSKDDQPKSNKNFKWKFPWDDNGGVHTNSGIPNHLFYLFCLNYVEVKGPGACSWDAPLDIWYNALMQLHSTSSFKDLKNALLKVCKAKYPELVPSLEDALKQVAL